MKVTTVSASVRYSKPLGDGSHKTVELSAEATPSLNENWTDAQASLYQQLGQQIKALWNGNQASNDGVQISTPDHYCNEHGTEFNRFEKDGRSWYAHRTAEGKWCREK